MASAVMQALEERFGRFGARVGTVLRKYGELANRFRGRPVPIRDAAAREAASGDLDATVLFLALSGHPEGERVVRAVIRRGCEERATREAKELAAALLVVLAAAALGEEALDDVDASSDARPRPPVQQPRPPTDDCPGTCSVRRW